jgi:ubiquinone/menaquinone biosynthesis C-methylase UbiE
VTRRADDAYVLGHSARELDRLDAQGFLYRDVTRTLILEAGVEPGMRVLDLGSGSGDVAFLAAELVGPGGQVVGLERDAGTVEAARNRAGARGLANVTFRVQELDAPVEGGPFDAVVGRFILMHQADPAAVLASVLRHARPGAPVAFVESTMVSLQDAAHSHPHSPLYDEIVRWKCAVVGGAGADLSAGLKLRRTFVDAGLPEPVTRLHARVEGGPDSPLYAYMADSVRSMLPQARRLGVEGFDDRSVDTLAGRLRAEVMAAGGVLVAWPVVTGWSRVGGG